MSERGKNIRNVLIVLGLAAIVWGVPGGDTASTTISNLLSVLLFAGLLFFAYRLYMEHRTTLFDLEGNLRAILYFAVAAAVFAIVGTDRMWDAGGASIFLWLALIAFAGFGVFHVITRYRAYD